MAHWGGFYKSPGCEKSHSLGLCMIAFIAYPVRRT